jgi:N-acetylneuraminic acid mutarotase
VKNSIKEGVEVTYDTAFPNVCPPQIKHIVAGKIKNGLFYPAGSVAKHFFYLEQNYTYTQTEKPHVYFIQSSNGPIKIGVATNVEARAASLQSGNPCPIKILAIIKNGGKELERELHKRFAADRLGGEWFQNSNSLKEVIDAARTY